MEPELSSQPVSSSHSVIHHQWQLNTGLQEVLAIIFRNIKKKFWTLSDWQYSTGSFSHLPPPPSPPPFNFSIVHSPVCCTLGLKTNQDKVCHLMDLPLYGAYDPQL